MRTGDNVRLRADGRFEARYAKGRNDQGRIIYGCCYGKTYDEAVSKRQEALRKNICVREMKLLILGAGSHGHEVKELAESLHIFREIAFLDDDPAKAATLGPCKEFAQYVDRFPIAIPAVGDRAVRMRWLNELAQAGFVLPVLIHPSAVVSPSARIGYGTVICARAAVGSGAVVGSGCIISSSATIDRDMVILEGTHIPCGQAVSAKTRINQEGVLFYG